MHPVYIAGVVAGEGCFTCSRNTFTFSVALGSVDAGMCHALHDFFGVGHVHEYRRRKDHYDDEIVFSVRKMRDLIDVIVPFMDEHLPPSYKRSRGETHSSTIGNIALVDAGRAPLKAATSRSGQEGCAVATTTRCSRGEPW